MLDKENNIMRNKWLGKVALIAALLVTGCTTVEFKSEQPEKRPLPVLAENQVCIESLWDKSTGSTRRPNLQQLVPSTDSDYLYFVNVNNKLTIIDLNSGAIDKSCSITTDDILAGISKKDDHIIFTTVKGNMINYNTCSHDIDWKVNLGTDVTAIPTIYKDKIFLHSLDDSIYAFDLKDGKQIFRYSNIQPPITLRKSSQPIIHNRNVISGLGNGKVISLEAVDGSLNWETIVSIPKGRDTLKRMNDVAMSPVVANGKIIASSYQGQTVGIDANSGQTIWQKPVSSSNDIIYKKGAVFIVDDNSVIWKLNPNNGNTFWKVSCLEGRNLSSPVSIQGYLIVADDEGFIHFIDMNDGQIVGRICGNKGETTNKLFTAAKDRLIVLRNNDNLIAYQILN